MSLVLLRSPDDWQNYRRGLAASVGLDDAHVEWGNGPDSYPCLVMGTQLPKTNPPRMLCGYVYTDDARRLLGLDDGGPESHAATTYIDTLRSLAAHVVALVAELVEVGVTNPERYETQYNKYLALTDQVLAERASVESVLVTAAQDDDAVAEADGEKEDEITE